jgi:ribosomal protein S18 acetylase RimI-like enzyme
LILAEADGQLVGSVIAGWDGWRCHLYRLAVAPDRRRQGIGSTLLKQAHAELAADGFTFLLDDFDPGEPWPGYLTRLEAHRLGHDLPPDLVASTFLAADVAGQLIGRVSIRHTLNDFLFRSGGHIGYGVRPAFRRRGHATAIGPCGSPRISSQAATGPWWSVTTRPWQQSHQLVLYTRVVTTAPSAQRMTP